MQEPRDGWLGTAPYHAYSGPPRPLVACTAPPVPPARLAKPVFYIDASQSVRDPRLVRIASERLHPLRVFGRGVAAMSDAYVAEPARQQAAARCTAEWLVDWARRGAITRRVDPWPSTDRAWFVIANAATAVAKIDPASAWRAGERELVLGWLRRLADDAFRQNARNFASVAGTRQVPNNQFYWVATSAVITGSVARDADLRDRGIEILRRGLLSIDRDGYLPAELTRKGRALHYTNYALQPLAVGMVWAKRGGDDLSGVNDGAFRRAALRLLATSRDPAPLEARLGVRLDQEPRDNALPLWAMAAAAVPDPAFIAEAERAGPQFSETLGGDAALIYAASFCTREGSDLCSGAERPSAERGWARRDDRDGEWAGQLDDSKAVESSRPAAIQGRESIRAR